MLAARPEELPEVFRHHLNAGDAAGLLSNYYAEDATYAPVPGVALRGDELATAVRRLVGLGAKIEVTVRHVYESGPTALILVDWALPEAGMTGTATDVARRQPDGTWKCVVDNPHGGASSIDIPEATARALAG